MQGASVHEFYNPIPEPNGKLYDEHGNTVRDIPQRRSGIVARVDDRASEKITLTKGTLWLLGASVVLLNLAFNYGGSMLSWARQDQSTVERQVQMQADIQRIAKGQEDMNAKFDGLSDRMRQQELQSAKIDGFKAGVAETESDKGNKK